MADQGKTGGVGCLIMIGLLLALIVGVAFQIYWTVLRPAAVVSYRYRLTVDVDGQIHSGSSVIGVQFAFNQPRLPPSWGVYNEHLSGQAVLIGLGARGVLVAALAGPASASGQRYDRCTVDAGYLVGRAYGSVATCDVGYTVTLENERAISRMQGPIELRPGNLPAFIWFADDTNLTTTKIVKPAEFSSVIGDSARLVSAKVEITQDPVVIDIDKKFSAFAVLTAPPNNGAYTIPGGLTLGTGEFINYQKY
jgi:hypothetical protein